MGLPRVFGRAIDRMFKPEVVPPRPVRYYERYLGIGPLRWWDKIGPETFRCRVCEHGTRTWRGMQTHYHQPGRPRPPFNDPVGFRRGR